MNSLDDVRRHAASLDYDLLSDLDGYHLTSNGLPVYPEDGGATLDAIEAYLLAEDAAIAQPADDISAGD